MTDPTPRRHTDGRPDAPPEPSAAHDHAHGHDHADDPDHEHDPVHAHDPEHKHEHTHEHGHGHGSGFLGLLAGLAHVHGHSDQQHLAAGPAVATAEGIRVIWLALGALSLTTVVQLVIVWLSGSVALLADMVHNLGDALNSVPLLIAFYLARRTATRRYTYGFGKAEDVAGIFIVLSIVVSAGFILWEAIGKLLNPTPLTGLPWVAAAAVVGFLGNEAVAWLQIRAGRRIGSDAMVADGLHARTDGLTSLAVLVAVAGTALGFPIADPIVGLLIGVTILFIARDAVRTMWYRLMDAVDPVLVDRVERAAGGVAGVQQVHDVRMRWLGHQLQAELHIVVDEDLPTRESHAIAEAVRHKLFQTQPQLAGVEVHVDPCGHGGGDPHAATAYRPQQPHPIH